MTKEIGMKEFVIGSIETLWRDEKMLITRWKRCKEPSELGYIINFFDWLAGHLETRSWLWQIMSP